MDITKPRTQTELIEYFAQLGFKTGAEIGVAKGRFSEVMCQKIPGLKLYCIDTWGVYPGNRRGGNTARHEANYAIAKDRLAKYDCQIIRKMSMEAVKEFEDGSLDFVFIDANHDYKYVLEDITEWSKKVRIGGIVSGHDYYNFHHSGVIEAVLAYASNHLIKPYLTSKNNSPIRDERQPCYWWIKE